MAVQMSRLSEEKLRDYDLGSWVKEFWTGGAGFSKDNTEALLAKTGVKCFR